MAFSIGAIISISKGVSLGRVSIAETRGTPESLGSVVWQPANESISRLEKIKVRRTLGII